MKRVRIILLIVVLAALAPFSAFSGGGDEEERTELLWIGIGGEAADIPLVFERLSEHLAEIGRDYSISYQHFGWGDYSQKIQLVLAAGERADIVFMASWAGNYFSTAASGYLTELDELVEAQPKLKDSLLPDFWDAVKVGGKIYGVPNYKDMVYQEYAAFNTDLLEKHGITIPENLTWENLTPILERIRDLEPDYIAYDGGGLGGIRGDFPLGITMPVVLSFAEPEKGFQVLTEIPEFQENARLMRRWTEAGLRDKDAYLNRDQGDEAAKKNWFVRNYQGFPGSEVNISKGWGVPLEVRWLDGPPILDNATPLGAVLSIPAASPNAEAAMDFLTLLNTDSAVRNLVGYGIEGVHYNTDENGQAARTEQGQNNYDMPNFSLGSLLMLNTVSGEPQDAREQLRRFNEEAQASPALGFSIDTEKYNQVIAQAAAISGTYRDSVKYGIAPADRILQEWRDKLREAGWFDMVEEVNRDYMNWKESR